MEKINEISVEALGKLLEIQSTPKNSLRVGKVKDFNRNFKKIATKKNTMALLKTLPNGYLG
jgi:hypothetical protein